MEEAVIEDKKKGEEKRKSTYTVGELSRLTKRGTSRSFSARGGNFSRGGSDFRGSSGQHLVDRWVSIETVSLVGSAASGTQSQSSVGSSGRGIERGRGRGKGRGTGNRDSDHTICGRMRGVGRGRLKQEFII
ncbi:UNVERIFIED_CONTAM: hypothetical protein Sangu_3028800 [Sesamum angustifolium]|uniref:Uncharacterized protein n=1 Tax=Sesamum angustifolium TaxID=2727405 RepID=A0AAW2KM34_9LAMI